MLASDKLLRLGRKHLLRNREMAMEKPIKVHCPAMLLGHVILALRSHNIDASTVEIHILDSTIVDIKGTMRPDEEENEDQLESDECDSGDDFGDAQHFHIGEVQHESVINTQRNKAAFAARGNFDDGMAEFSVKATIQLDQEPAAVLDACLAQSPQGDGEDDTTASDNMGAGSGKGNDVKAVHESHTDKLCASANQKSEPACDTAAQCPAPSTGTCEAGEQTVVTIPPFAYPGMDAGIGCMDEAWEEEATVQELPRPPEHDQPLLVEAAETSWLPESQGADSRSSSKAKPLQEQNEELMDAAGARIHVASRSEHADGGDDLLDEYVARLHLCEVRCQITSVDVHKMTNVFLSLPAAARKLLASTLDNV